MVRQQFLMLVIDEEAAIAALPGLLPPDEAERLAVLDMLRGVLAAAGPLDGESARRMERVTAIFAPPAACDHAPARSQRPRPPDVQHQTLKENDSVTDHTTAARSKHDILIDAANDLPPAPTLVVHPCDATSLAGRDRSAGRGPDPADPRRPRRQDPRTWRRRRGST